MQLSRQVRRLAFRVPVNSNSILPFALFSAPTLLSEATLLRNHINTPQFNRDSTSSSPYILVAKHLVVVTSGRIVGIEGVLLFRFLKAKPDSLVAQPQFWLGAPPIVYLAEAFQILASSLFLCLFICEWSGFVPRVLGG